jgi:hypothetical protein
MLGYPTASLCHRRKMIRESRGHRDLDIILVINSLSSLRVATEGHRSVEPESAVYHRKDTESGVCTQEAREIPGLKESQAMPT